MCECECVSVCSAAHGKWLLNIFFWSYGKTKGICLRQGRLQAFCKWLCRQIFGRMQGRETTNSSLFYTSFCINKDYAGLLFAFKSLIWINRKKKEEKRGELLQHMVPERNSTWDHVWKQRSCPEGCHWLWRGLSANIPRPMYLKNWLLPTCVVLSSFQLTMQSTMLWLSAVSTSISTINSEKKKKKFVFVIKTTFFILQNNSLANHRHC